MAKFAVTRFASGNGKSPAQARTALGATDTVDWGALPTPVGTLLNFVSGPGGVARQVAFKSMSGLDGSITHPLDLVRLTQGAIGGWVGNFPKREALLFTNDRPPPVTDPLKESIVIHFSQPIRGVGLQFQGSTAAASTTLRFKANLILWNLDNSDWGQPDHAVGSASDGSAVFLGAVAADPVVSTVQLYVDAMNGQQIDLAIGRISLVT